MDWLEVAVIVLVLLVLVWAGLVWGVWTIMRDIDGRGTEKMGGGGHGGGHGGGFGGHGGGFGGRGGGGRRGLGHNNYYDGFGADGYDGPWFDSTYYGDLSDEYYPRPAVCGPANASWQFLPNGQPVCPWVPTAALSGPW